jgi:hypothetical protein
LSGYNYIQISVPISHGSSGGALFNTNGEVIGITSSGIEEGQNLNFAIPINDLKPLLKENKVLSFAQVYEREHIIIYSNGDKYEGDLKDGYRNGNGVYTYATGAIYNGGWLNGEFSGHGVLTFPDGEYYDGEWLNGTKNGYGVLLYGTDIKYKYEGYFLNGEFNGNGIWTLKNGKIIGNWVNGKLEGKAIYIDEYNVRHEIEYLNDKLIRFDGKNVN